MSVQNKVRNASPRPRVDVRDFQKEKLACANFCSLSARSWHLARACPLSAGRPAPRLLWSAITAAGIVAGATPTATITAGTEVGITIIGATTIGDCLFHAGRTSG